MVDRRAVLAGLAGGLLAATGGVAAVAASTGLGRASEALRLIAAHRQALDAFEAAVIAVDRVEDEIQPPPVQVELWRSSYPDGPPPIVGSSVEDIDAYFDRLLHKNPATRLRREKLLAELAEAQERHDRICRETGLDIARARQDAADDAEAQATIEWSSCPVGSLDDARAKARYMLDLAERGSACLDDERVVELLRSIAKA